MNNLFISEKSFNVNGLTDITSKKAFLIQRKSSIQIHQEQKLKSINEKIAKAHAKNALLELGKSSNELTEKLNNRIKHELLPYFNQSSVNTLNKAFKPYFQYDEVFNNEDSELEKTTIQAQADKAAKKRQAMLEHGEFFSMIPATQLDAVWWRINKIYRGNVKDYIKSVPLFLKLFSKTMLHEANATIVVDDSEKRKLKRRKKEALLYSSQLLCLIGFKAASYINDSLLEYYLQDRQEQIEFTEKTRLISSNGKFRKLTPFDVREKRKTAQILNVSDTLTQIAQDRGWTFTFLTITLPACKHPNPMNGHNTFDGELPHKAHRRIQRFWQRIRAYLARYEMVAFNHYMGAMTSEVHQDSTIHLHIIIYHSKENSLLVNKAIVGVSHNGEKKTQSFIEKQSTL